jgi:hypothetical protein
LRGSIRQPQIRHSGAFHDSAVPPQARARPVIAAAGREGVVKISGSRRYVTALNSSRYRATPDTPAMASMSSISAMNTTSGMPTH